MSLQPLQCEDCQQKASKTVKIHQFTMAGVNHIRCSGCMDFDQFGHYLRQLREQDIRNNPIPQQSNWETWLSHRKAS